MPWSTTHRRPFIRVLLRLALAVSVFAFLVALLEGFLQLGAYVVWRSQCLPVAGATGRAVLCVGDSWTYGMGSASPHSGSYPSRMQVLLRERGFADATVVNGGQSGQNSRDVLQRLPSQLDEVRPRVVCVLVGLNDYWTRPDRLPEDVAAQVDHTAFRFRWRLLRLVQWGLGALNDGGVASKPEDRDPAAWATRKMPPVPDPHAKEPSDWLWTPELQQLKDDGWAAKSRGDLLTAAQSFERAKAVSPDDPQVRQALSDVMRQAGALEAADREVEWLRAAWASRGGYLVGASFAWSLVVAGRWQEALQHARAFVERYPQSAQVWRIRGQAEFQLGLAADALRSLDRADAIGFDRWNWFTRYKVHFLARRDLDEAICTVFACYAIDNDESATAEWLLAIAVGAPSNLARAAELVDGLTCDAETRERLRQIVAGLVRSASASAADAVLEDHLGRMVVAIRNAGAEPLVLCYPWRMAADTSLRRAAAELGARFVPVGEEFARRTVGLAEKALRAADGHCNDHGYSIMAEIVAEAVGSALR